MQIYKRVQLKKRELLQLQNDCEGYIWAAVDPVNYAISFGDDYLADLRDLLLVKRSHLENIFGIGLDLRTGEINYVKHINRRNPRVGCSGNISNEDKENIEEVLHYFFEKLPAYREGEKVSDTTIAFC
jgi:hypothetical protein